MPRVTPTDDPLRQFNIRIPESMFAAIEQRRLTLAAETGESISRDEWGRRALAHVLDTTTPGSPNPPATLTTPAGRATRPRRNGHPR